MVFPGLLASSSRASSARSRPAVDTPAPTGDRLQLEYIYDEAQLPRVPSAEPDLRELNHCLEALAAVFPDIQIEVFRELLSSFDGESRLALVADGILKNRAAWVKGRWRVADKQGSSSEVVPAGERFKSAEYKKAVENLAWTEFKGMYKSTVKAVLAENNYSYLEARRTLVTLSSKSWRFTIANLFSGKRPPATGQAESHPLVVWRSTGQGSITPTIRPTGCAELDRELFNTLIAPLKQRDQEEREIKDRCLAVLLNNEEAEEAGATHECACCFTSGPFEEFTHCNLEGHMICFRCVQHSIKEALFGQGWLSSIDPDRGTLRCIAVDGSGCPGHIPADHTRRAMLEEKKGIEILHKLDQRLAEHNLVASNLPLVRCPFCSYAEVDDIYMPSRDVLPQIRADSSYNLILLVLCVGSVVLALPFVLLISLICVVLSVGQTFGHYLLAEWKLSLARHRRRRRGHKFSCQSPECGRLSCLSCHKSWTDIHICNESSLVALRTQIEQAMSMAIKRVCPRCNTSFVKNAGCNKLTCPCGYKMCYVCRSDLSDEGYRHFCDHFRPDGDPRPCTECDRCNLWESEDTDRVLQAAREEAEHKWKSSEKRDLSGAEKSFLETGYATRTAEISLQGMLSGGGFPTVPQLFDIIIDTIFV
ncbi:hypothetical protein S40285_05587 [Stachybotrys chlorohalonatus IBT 40285]|uniref:RING-type domain-containing protein n=1 Tax=Stachybotrys chlorohalonatus (strain IBT 40285) TaxID=1283841 RepID=A0A084QEX5_STAC4|nr:hypothetical protein S40285_05587 [Stachybotrys chlorohalonata IBT 40285]